VDFNYTKIQNPSDSRTSFQYHLCVLQLFIVYNSVKSLHHWNYASSYYLYSHALQSVHYFTRALIERLCHPPEREKICISTRCKWKVPNKSFQLVDCYLLSNLGDIVIIFINHIADMSQDKKYCFICL